MMSKFDWGEVPKTKSYQFADLAELLLLVGDYDEISHSDLQVVIGQGGPDTDPDDDQNDPSHPVELNAREQGYIKSCFNHFAYRVGAFDDIYPFKLENEILIKKPMITERNYLYLFLLGCSRLGSFKDLSFRQHCAHLFVDVAACSLRWLMCNNAKIWVFDVNSADRRNHFSNNLHDALRALGTEISERPDEIVVAQQAKQGDGGLDLVGVLQFPDRGRGYFTVFGQCAAQQEGWPLKTLETRRLNPLFNFSHKPYNFNFIPVLYRQSNGEWINEVHTSDCLIVDRVRIMKTLFHDDRSLPSELFSTVKACVESMASVYIAEAA